MIQTEKVVTDRFGMPFFRFGTGSRTMVILPGLSLKRVTESAEAVAGAYKMFAEDHTVFLFDRRSDLPEGYTVRDMAHDTAEAMDSLGIRGAYVFGVSQGGMIAQLIAAERPELVKKLVLGSTAARLSDSAGSILAEWKKLAEQGDAKGLAAAFADAVYSPRYIEKYRSAFDFLAEHVTAEELKRFVILSGGTERFDAYGELDGISCPTFVIGAGNDRVLGVGASRDIAEKLGCELYIYPDGSHAAYDEEPDYKDRIYGFFAKDDCPDNK